MSEQILPEIKRDFLIIGVTGPLRSGCSTVAKFFDNELEIKIKKYTSDMEQDQKEIKQKYEEISKLIAASQQGDYKIKIKKKLLDELLKKREIKKVLAKELSEGVIPSFYSISMSEMLLKYAVEFFLNNESRGVDGKYGEIVGAIKKKGFEHKRINTINEIIREKRYRELEDGECEFYDNYLEEIKDLTVKLKEDFETEKLGDILQDMGDNIRKHGDPFRLDGEIEKGKVVLLADQSNHIIKYMRNRQDDARKRKHHFVIECFRNPFEIEYLRYRYAEFYLLSIFSEEMERQSRGAFFENRDKRDKGDGSLEDIHRQNVSRCVYLSDIAINNDSKIDTLHKKLLYYYSLIRQPGCVTPAVNETFMDQAYSLSLMSSCISRQVGAVIIGKNGYVVGAGWNDVGQGQVGCGYRQVIDTKDVSEDILVTNPVSKRDFRKDLQISSKPEDSFCFKDEYSRYTMKEKYVHFDNKLDEVLKTHGATIKEQKDIKDLLPELIKTKRLEYCRALHAEENALLQTAKIGGMGVMDGTIYTTTFPCELCAKMIYQVGIKEIVYTEPYPESISLEVFLRDGIKKIKLTQFEGVKSSSYFWLYKASMDKKELQVLQNLELV